MAKTRTCQRCQVEKPVGAFNKDRHTHGGRRRTCRECLDIGPLDIEVACLVCRRLSNLSGEEYLRFLARPWACDECSHTAKWRNQRKQARRCDTCEGWVRPPKRSRGLQQCVVCRARTGKAKPRPCAFCRQPYFTGRRETCSDTCARRLKSDAAYFGGRLRDAEGWDARLCQCCGRYVPKGYQIHHVYGHPNHSRLVLLCPGCHELVGKISWRKLDVDTIERIVAFGLMQLHKHRVTVRVTATHPIVKAA